MKIYMVLHPFYGRVYKSDRNALRLRRNLADLLNEDVMLRGIIIKKNPPQALAHHATENKK